MDGIGRADQPGGTSVPRWIEIPAGILLGLFTLLCLAGSTTLIFSANNKAPILAPLIGLVLIVGSVWVLEKCIRLVTGRARKGGLLSPTALRAAGWMFLLLPIGGIFTGYYREHPVASPIQIAGYISAAAGVRRLAAARDLAATAEQLSKEGPTRPV